MRSTSAQCSLDSSFSFLKCLRSWFFFFLCFISVCSAGAHPFAACYVPSTAPSGDCDLQSGALGTKNTFLASFSLGFANGCTRIGEASHPGPSSTLTLGTTNPGGLRLKEGQAVALGAGIWSLCETQLSSFTQRSAAKALRALARQQDRCLRPCFGSPAPLRPRSSWAGSWTGVACVSDYPSKILQIEWPPDLWLSGRVLATQHFLGRATLTVVTIYGLPRGPTWPQAAQHMADILEFLTKTFLFGHSGLVAIQGDFNFSPDELPHFHQWRSLGWIDAQTLAQDRWDFEWRPTCKGAKERDIIWMSPALASLCQGVQIRSACADHDAVSVSLRIPDETIQYWTWPRPCPIPWHQVDIDSWAQHCDSLDFEADPDSTTCLADFGQHLEQSLSGFVNGGQPLHPSHCGRAKRLRPKTFSQNPPGAHASRQGEITLASDLVGQAVQLWFKQARRIQSYLHSIRAGKMTPHALAYRLEVWSAILHAKGFQRDFAGWWQEQAHVRLLGPLPRHPPSLDFAEALFQAFQHSFREFERWHLDKRNEMIKAKYDRNLQAIFHDLRDSHPDQIDCLWESQTYTITAIRPGSKMVLVDKPVENIPHAAWFRNGCGLDVTTTLEELVLFSSWPDLQVGDQLIQHTHTSSDSGVHDALLSLWKPRWQNPQMLSPEDWTRVTNFVRAFMPSFHFVLEDITEDEWRAAVRRLKDRAAVGVDGFSKADLRNMSSFHLRHLLRFFHDIEHGTRSWPKQFYESLVLGLAKHAGAHQAGSFRPIVLFSMLYRIWGSIRCRQILRQLEVFAHSDALGFLPGRETLQAWVQIQGCVELSLQSQVPLAGIATDIVKAFNCIHRPQWFVLAQHVGLPGRILHPWKQFLANFTRRFQVNCHLSEPVGSSVGFAEGDPFSVAAMALLDWALHVYQVQMVPKLRTLSFVDNVSLVSCDVGRLLQGFFSLLTFQALWGLTTDIAKSYAWSTLPAWRNLLKPLGIKVVEDAAELGGTLSLCASRRVRIFLQRGHALDRKWHRLRLSKAPLAQKLTVLPIVFWSSALHGALGVVFSDLHIHELRKTAVSNLRLRLGGSNPLLRLSLSEPMTADPGFYQLRHCLFDFRRACWKTPDLVTQWGIFMDRFDGGKTAGPFYKLVTLFSMLGWHFDAVPTFFDHDGCQHDLLLMPNALLESLLREGWLRWVASQVSHRQTMSDLGSMDEDLVFLDRHVLSASDLSKVLALQTGAFISSKQHSKYDPSKSGDCAVCHVPDNQRHWLHCPRFGSLQMQQEAIRPWIADVPLCVLHHLLPPRNPFVFDLKFYFSSLKDDTPVFLSIPGHGHQHLFTDGSCFQRSVSYSTTASWAVVNATTGLVTGHGHVFGLLQSSARAELSAICAALRWIVRYQVTATIWCDSQFAVRGLRNLLSGRWVISLSVENHDLWTCIAELVEQIPDGTLTVNWIPSHLDSSLCDSGLEEWISCWNNVVDTCAVSTNEHRGPHFQFLLEQALQHFELWSARLRALRDFYLGVSEANADESQVIDLSHDVSSDELAAITGSLCISDALPLNWKQQMKECFPTSENHFSFTVQIFENLFILEQHASEFFQISFIELTLWLVQDRGLPVLVSDGNGDWDLRSYSGLLLRPTVASLVQNVRQTMKKILLHLDLAYFVQHSIARLESGIQLSTDGLIVHSSFDQISRCSELSRIFAGSRQLRKAADLARPL